MSKEASIFFNNYKKGLLNVINTCLIGIIEKFDGETMKANVTLLPNDDLILDVPVMTLQTSEFYIRVPYEPGDHVLVVFSQRDIDQIMHSGDASPSDRVLSIDDAIIIGGINLFDDPLPSEDKDKLVIGQKDGGAKITMADGKINFVGEVTFTNNVKLNGSTTVKGSALNPGGDNF